MRVDLREHTVAGACQLRSPNCDDRPEGCVPELIVLHSISLPPGCFEGDSVQQLFTNRLDTSQHPYFTQLFGLEVSSHVYIRRDGELIQFVPFNKRAWHAGKSVYRGRERCNDFSIGIELEGTDDTEFTCRQYAVLCTLLNALFMAYPTLSSNRIVGHCDIAPQRKTDPGPYFDWARLKRGLVYS